jgi:hypothetical protein
MVITNTYFEDDAEEFAGSEKIILREGIQVVEDIVRLADAKDWLEIEKNSYAFTKKKFDEYLDQQGGPFY